MRYDAPMATKKEPTKIERRDFLKKTGAAAGVLAAGFPAIISGQSVTNSLKLGLVGCGGRGSGAAGQALTADPNNVLTAVADIDEQIAEAAVTRLKNSQKYGDRVKIEGAFAGLDAYDKVINSVDVVLLATPPGFRPQHLTAAVNANKHVFCEKPCATDSPGVRAGHRGAEARPAEEPVARGRVLLALQQHDHRRRSTR